MTHGHGKSNGERSWTAESPERVTWREDGEDEYEGDDQLDEEDLLR